MPPELGKGHSFVVPSRCIIGIDGDCLLKCQNGIFIPPQAVKGKALHDELLRIIDEDTDAFTKIIAAFGAVPVRFCSGIYEAVHPANDLLGDAGLCPLVKSTLGLKMSGASPILELCDLVVVPTPCDAKLKLSELLSERVPVWLVEVPNTKESTEARRAWLRQKAPITSTSTDA
jgi:hypothetical protein